MVCPVLEGIHPAPDGVPVGRDRPGERAVPLLEDDPLRQDILLEAVADIHDPGRIRAVLDRDLGFVGLRGVGIPQVVEIEAEVLIGRSPRRRRRDPRRGRVRRLPKDAAAADDLQRQARDVLAGYGMRTWPREFTSACPGIASGLTPGTVTRAQPRRLQQAIASGRPTRGIEK